MSLGEVECMWPTLQLWRRTRFRSRVWWGVWQLALPRDEREIFISTGRRHGGWPQSSTESSWRGTTTHKSSESIAHCGCCCFSQEQHHLHFIRLSPMALHLSPRQGHPIPSSSCPNSPPQLTGFNPPSFPWAVLHLPLGAIATVNTQSSQGL